MYRCTAVAKTDVLEMSSVNFTSSDTNETIATTNPATNNCSEWIEKEKNTQNPSKKMEFSSSFHEIPSNIQPQPARQGLFSCNTPPNDAGFVSWLMLFSCVISHPSVMFYKSTIQKIGGTMNHFIMLKIMTFGFVCLCKRANQSDRYLG